MTALISAEDNEFVASRRVHAVQSSRPLGAMTWQRVSLLLEAFSSSLTSLGSDIHEFLRDVKDVPVYMPHKEEQGTGAGKSLV